MAKQLSQQQIVKAFATQDAFLTRCKSEGFDEGSLAKTFFAAVEANLAGKLMSVASLAKLNTRLEKIEAVRAARKVEATDGPELVVDDEPAKPAKSKSKGAPAPKAAVAPAYKAGDVIEAEYEGTWYAVTVVRPTARGYIVEWGGGWANSEVRQVRAKAA